MGRSLLIILTVAAIAGWLNRAEQAGGVSPTASQVENKAGRWVRTVDGWETRTALEVRPAAPLEIHPGLVAGVMATASLLALAVFPGKAEPVRQAATIGVTVQAPVTSRGTSLSRKRRRRIVPAAR